MKFYKYNLKVFLWFVSFLDKDDCPNFFGVENQNKLVRAEECGGLPVGSTSRNGDLNSLCAQQQVQMTNNFLAMDSCP